MTYVYKKRLTIAAVLAASISAFGLWWVFSTPAEAFVVENFVYERDAEDIFTFFEKDWYWLMASPKGAYGPDYVKNMFKYRAPAANPLYRNTLNIKVVRDNGKAIGFTAYYKKSKKIGQLLFVAVDERYRGQRLGEKLARYALDALIKDGSEHINLLTRTNNEPAKRLYERLGFYEAYRDGEDFVYYRYDV